MASDPTPDIAAAIRGDRDARQAIAEAYRTRIHRYITTMVGGSAEIPDDLTQECFLTAFDKLDQLRDPDRLGPWLYTIAVNLCRRHLRQAATPSSNPKHAQALEADPAESRRSLLSSIVARESATALAIAIDRLPILLREALVLHFVEGLPYTEIAAITEVRAETLHVRAHRAKALLRKQLGSAVDTFWVERADS